jgi:hypothetical protein
VPPVGAVRQAAAIGGGNTKAIGRETDRLLPVQKKKRDIRGRVANCVAGTLVVQASCLLF